MYTRPSVTVILENWAKTQPSDFSLEYLLTHAIESQWQLTEEGWKNAEEMGLLGDLRKPIDPADSDDGEIWLTNAEAARQLGRETSEKYTFESLKSMLSKRASTGTIKIKGNKGADRRYAKSAVNALELKLRNGLLDSDDDSNWH